MAYENHTIYLRALKLFKSYPYVFLLLCVRTSIHEGYVTRLTVLLMCLHVVYEIHTYSTTLCAFMHVTCW